MFGKKKSTGIRQAKFATLIAHDVQLSGNLEFSEGLRLDGHVQGNISGKAGSETLLVLSDRGSVTGNVHGHDIVINGKIIGDVVADHFVELQANAHVTGNIDYLQLRMDAGATVDGKLTRRDSPTAAPALPPPGTTAEQGR
ncbi:polymer-forming cytoskeletal protein [Variovorax sp. J31P179]|jgi:cytoskeletal protein CcmA (bactofilin family)|uniref:bactofilin family protein n=1 Tax=Variovorax sp. J31P179 TaxID=3053508 RepID=UPI002578F710|nr:polymer-forming cytoskeletal protein [Variovorax sp. J31P179]MDM0084288.1 polymer-forming cytoskeletal protein [Variovorax sp. J31P179]HET7835658.1 polymer-forming cytoskeletal protein [Variovorax sp.]